jgi:hypothetical protein
MSNSNKSQDLDYLSIVPESPISNDENNYCDDCAFNGFGWITADTMYLELDDSISGR